MRKDARLKNRPGRDALSHAWGNNPKFLRGNRCHEITERLRKYTDFPRRKQELCQKQLTFTYVGLYMKSYVGIWGYLFLSVLGNKFNNKHHQISKLAQPIPAAKVSNQVHMLILSKIILRTLNCKPRININRVT